MSASGQATLEESRKIVRAYCRERLSGKEPSAPHIEPHLKMLNLSQEEIEGSLKKALIIKQAMEALQKTLAESKKENKKSDQIIIERINAVCTFPAIFHGLSNKFGIAKSMVFEVEKFFLEEHKDQLDFAKLEDGDCMLAMILKKAYAVGLVEKSHTNQPFYQALDKLNSEKWNKDFYGVAAELDQLLVPLKPDLSSTHIALLLKRESTGSTVRVDGKKDDKKDDKKSYSPRPDLHAAIPSMSTKGKTHFAFIVERLSALSKKNSQANNTIFKSIKDIAKEEEDLDIRLIRAVTAVQMSLKDETSPLYRNEDLALLLIDLEKRCKDAPPAQTILEVIQRAAADARSLERQDLDKETDHVVMAQNLLYRPH